MVKTITQIITQVTSNIFKDYFISKIDKSMLMLKKKNELEFIYITWYMVNIRNTSTTWS